MQRKQDKKGRRSKAERVKERIKGQEEINEGGRGEKGEDVKKREGGREARRG